MPEAAHVNVDELRRRARRRLIGAIVLALVAATVVPLLLESEPKPLGEEVAIKIPPIDDGKFVSRLTDSSQREPSIAGSTKAESGKDSLRADALLEKQDPANPSAKADTSVPTKGDAGPGTPAKNETPKEGFAVQLAAFADDKGANALANKLKRTGYPAYTESLTTSKSTLWRVRVGPYPSRDAAGEARIKLKDDGYNGIVAPASVPSR